MQIIQTREENEKREHDFRSFQRRVEGETEDLKFMLQQKEQELYKVREAADSQNVDPNSARQ